MHFKSMLILLLLFCPCDALNLNHANVTEPYTGAQYITKAYMPIVGPFEDKFFGKTSLTEIIWDSVPGSSFCPSIVPLPQTIKEALHEKDAQFLAAFRNEGPQCMNLGKSPDTKNRNLHLDIFTSLVLLNGDFQPVAKAKITFSIGTDARIFFHNDILVVNYMTYGKAAPVWHMHTLGLQVNQTSGELVADKGTLSNAFPSVHSEELVHVNARNLGILEHENQTYILWWADGNTTDVESITMARIDHAYHLSGNPIHIPEKGVYLTILHTHANPTFFVHRSMYGSEYMQYFLVMEDQPPFAVKGLSAPFCMSSLDRAHKEECEIIQIIGSILRDPQDPQTLLIAYGVNDCEAAMVRLPLEVALKSAEAYNSTGGLPKNMQLNEFAKL